MQNLAGKVILVTGASSGLGEATVRLLAERGAKVVLAARRLGKCEAIAADIAADGGEALCIATDVTDPSAIDAMVAKAVERFGRLDGAVNNAGIVGDATTPAADITDENWDRVIGINLTAVWRCMKAQIPAMLASGGGNIVNVSSIYGLIASNLGHAAYAASKFGVIGLTQSAATDYAQQDMRINAVCPGFFRSEMTEPAIAAAPKRMAAMAARMSAMIRFAEASEVAEAIAWLLSDAASFVNGAAIPIDGGSTPRLY